MVISHSEGKDSTFQQTEQAQSAIWNPSKYRQILNNDSSTSYRSTTANGTSHGREDSNNKLNPPRNLSIIHKSSNKLHVTKCVGKSIGRCCILTQIIKSAYNGLISQEPSTRKPRVGRIIRTLNKQGKDIICEPIIRRRR